jgi:hypothetical protein
MKHFFLALTFCASTTMIFAQTASKTTKVIPASAPTEVKAAVTTENLTVSKEAHEFGKIPQGTPVTTVFTITNNSKTAFKLDNVQASCGCTTPEWNKEEMIQPGKSTAIKVGFNAAAPGPFDRVITITYNGTESKQVHIKGEVWAAPAASAPANEAKHDMQH